MDRRPPRAARGAHDARSPRRDQRGCPPVDGAGDFLLRTDRRLRCRPYVPRGVGAPDPGRSHHRRVIAFLAGRGIAENFAAGVILQTRRPIEIGDDVDILDHSGIVREINARSVVLETWDRRRIHIPNSTVLSNPLVNHTAYASRRSEVEVRLAIGNGLDDAVTDVVETIAAVPGVLADPPPEVIYRTVDSKRVDRGPFRP
jgi:hypothetical protein